MILRQAESARQAERRGKRDVMSVRAGDGGRHLREVGARSRHDLIAHDMETCAAGSYAYTIFDPDFSPARVANTRKVPLARIEMRLNQNANSTSFDYCFLARRPGDRRWFASPVQSAPGATGALVYDLAGPWRKVNEYAMLNALEVGVSDDTAITFSPVSGDGSFASVFTAGTIDAGGVYVAASDGARLRIDQIVWRTPRPIPPTSGSRHWTAWR